MAARRAHQKSRRGCQTCKRRRVKCDESGPPCGKCLAQGIACKYAIPDPRSHSYTSVSTPSSENPRINLGRQRSSLLGELELMHHWSTVTYKSLATPILNDEDVWQTTVTRLALKHDFLLYGLFAVAAFDMASSGHEAGYSLSISTALDFQDRAFSTYRAQLYTITPDSHEALLYFSTLLVVLTLASAQFAPVSAEPGSKIQRMVEYFELLRGMTLVMMSQKDCTKSYALFRNVTPMRALPRKLLDHRTEIAITAIKELNEIRNVSSPEESSDVRLNTLLYQGACKKALFWLEECFITCDNNDYRTWCLGWIAMPGDDYIKAIKAKDQVALIILAYWAVLIHGLERNLWYTKGFGTCLIHEISDLVAERGGMAAGDILRWAQDRVSGTDT